MWKHIDMGRQYENGIQRRALSPVPNYSPSSFRFVSLTATELLKYHSIRHSLLLSNYYSISYDRGTTKIVILGQILSLDVNTIIYPPPPALSTTSFFFMNQITKCRDIEDIEANASSYSKLESALKLENLSGYRRVLAVLNKNEVNDPENCEVKIARDTF